MGSSVRMGPGYFPTILSVLMMVLGVVMTGLAWRGSKVDLISPHSHPAVRSR